MGKLALKIVLLILPFLLLAGYTEYRLRRLPNSYSVKASQLESRAGSIEILILGSSHALHGIDPARFDLPAYNMANSSQSLYYDYEIVRRELPRLKSLRAVVLPVSYFSLETSPAPAVEDWRCFFYLRFYGIPVPQEVERRYPFYDPMRHSFIAMYSFPQSRRFLLKKFRRVNPAERIDANGWHPVGDPSPDAISEASGRTRAAFHQGGMDPSNITPNAGYLARTIELLQGRGVTPVLVTLPAYRTYYENVKPESYARMMRQMEEISRRYGVHYLDYFRDARFGRDDFFDNDHLSRSGAEKVSALINSEIKELPGLNR